MSLFVQDSAATRNVLFQEDTITVNSTTLTRIESSNHAIYLTLELNGGVNTVVYNYSRSSSAISDTQYRSACAAGSSTAKAILYNTVDTITQCVSVLNSGSIVLIDPYVWDFASISSSLLTVPGRYQAEVFTSTGVVVLPQLSAETFLNITCGQYNNVGCPVSGTVLWNIGGTDAQDFAWSSTLCSGNLESDVYPTILFSGAGATNVTTNLASASASYNYVAMSSLSVNISAPSSVLSMNMVNNHQLFVVASLSQNTELQLLQPASDSIITTGAALPTCRQYSSSSTILASMGTSTISSLQLCLTVSGHALSVVDPIPWDDIFVEADALSVPSRYMVNLVGSDVTLYPQILSSTLLEVTCGQPPSFAPAAWIIQNYNPSRWPFPPANFTSTSTACSLSVGGSVLPQLLYSGPGSTVANLQLYPDNVAQRSFSFATGSFNVTADNTQYPILLSSEITHMIQVMVNSTQGQNTLVLGYESSQSNPLDAPAILGSCTSAAQSLSSSPSVAIANTGDNTTYCFISAQGSLVVSDTSILEYGIITGNTWRALQRYRVDLINWEDIYINPPVTTDTVIEVQCGIPSNVQNTPYWRMGMNQISNVTWQGTACQGVITNLFPAYNFSGEGSTAIVADLMSSSPSDVVTRNICASPNSLRVEVLPDVANISIYSAHPISVSLRMTGGANNLVSSYPISSSSESSGNSSGCVADSSSSAALFFSNMLDSNTYCMVTYDGLIFVEDEEEWTETIINSSTLTVPFRYNVELLNWEGVYFLAFTNKSVVNVYCNDPNVTDPFSWRIGTNTTASANGGLEGAIVWHSSSCSGVLIDLFPQLIFSSNGSTNVSLLVDQSFSPTSITLNTLNMQILEPYAYVASDSNQTINLNILIEAQGTEVVLDRDPTPTFVPSLESDTPTAISSLRPSSVTLAGHLKFHVDTSSIQSNPNVSLLLKKSSIYLFEC